MAGNQLNCLLGQVVNRLGEESCQEVGKGDDDHEADERGEEEGIFKKGMRISLNDKEE